MNLFKRLFVREDDRASVRPLYLAVSELARHPRWYLEGQVPDTIEGRFEMVTLILALVLIRLDGLGESAAGPAALLAETFVEDMDGQLRQLGMGDVVVGKHIGKMMSALGGRLGAYRAGLAGDAPIGDALLRNLYAGLPPSDGSLDYVKVAARAILEGLNQRSLEALFAGDIV